MGTSALCLFVKSCVRVLDIVLVHVQESLKKQIPFSQNGFTAKSTFTKQTADVNQHLIFIPSR